MAKSNLCAAIVVVILSSIALFLQQVYVNHWYNTPPTRPEDWPAGNVTFLQAPITHYKFGEIDKVLTEFDPGFMVYRPSDPENFKFDRSRINGDVHAKTLVPDEKCRRSIICYACYDDSVNIKDMKFEELMNSPGHYSQYTRLTPAMNQYFWDSFKLPFSVKDTVTENGFFANFKTGRITAQIHANPITSSLAMQAIGYKIWYFFPNELTLAKDGFEGGLTTPVLFPKHAPTRDSYTVYYTLAGPGDIIFFPEAYAHVVYTFEGPNALINYRKLFVSNFMSSPYTFFSSMFNRLFVNQLSTHPAHSKGKDAGLLEQEFSTPLGKSKPKAFTSQLFEHAIARNKQLCENHPPTPFDLQFVGKLDELVAEARAQGVPFLDSNSA